MATRSSTCKIAENTMNMLQPKIVARNVNYYKDFRPNYVLFF